MGKSSGPFNQSRSLHCAELTASLHLEDTKLPTHHGGAGLELTAELEEKLLALCRYRELSKIVKWRWASCVSSAKAWAQHHTPGVFCCSSAESGLRVVLREKASLLQLLSHEANFWSGKHKSAYVWRPVSASGCPAHCLHAEDPWHPWQQFPQAWEKNPSLESCCQRV